MFRNKIIATAESGRRKSRHNTRISYATNTNAQKFKIRQGFGISNYRRPCTCSLSPCGSEIYPWTKDLCVYKYNKYMFTVIVSVFQNTCRNFLSKRRKITHCFIQSNRCAAATFKLNIRCETTRKM